MCEWLTENAPLTVLVAADDIYAEIDLSLIIRKHVTLSWIELDTRLSHREQQTSNILMMFVFIY